MSSTSAETMSFQQWFSKSSIVRSLALVIGLQSHQLA
jgi:hypothetical protein